VMHVVRGMIGACNKNTAQQLYYLSFDMFSPIS
jgi:hypothetical protein